MLWNLLSDFMWDNIDRNGGQASFPFVHTLPHRNCVYAYVLCSHVTAYTKFSFQWTNKRILQLKINCLLLRSKILIIALHLCRSFPSVKFECSYAVQVRSILQWSNRRHAPAENKAKLWLFKVQHKETSWKWLTPLLFFQVTLKLMKSSSPSLSQS